LRKYTTIQGDMWDGIAKRVYGDERYMNTLLDANQAHNNTVVFSAGINLSCPAVATREASILPPWKRGKT